MMSLVHAYPFNEGAGTTTADTAGAAVVKNGTLYSNGAIGAAATADNLGVSWQTANPSPAGGTYLHFDGAPVSPNTDSFIGNGGRVDLAPTDAITESLHNEMGKSASVTTWMRITPDGTEYIGNDTMWRAPAITGNEQAGAGNDNFFGWVTSDGRVGMQKGDAASAVSAVSVADGAWHHVAVTKNYDTGEAKVYVDGRLSSTVTTAPGPVSAFWDSLGAITDVKGDGLGLDGYNYMNNTDLDDVRLYNHVLTQGEILAQLPSTLSGPLTAPTAVVAAIDAANPRQVNLTFTDANANEAGFVIERAFVNPDGSLGGFTQAGQLASGTAGRFTEVAPVAFNQPIVYRVRSFNTTGESTNVVSNPVTVTSAGDLHGASAGYLNSNFWGATNRQWPTDPDPTDAAVPGGGAENVGAISLVTGQVDPSNPEGIVVRNPDVAVIDPLTQVLNTGGVGSLRRDWGTGSPNPAIRVDNHTTIYTGKITIGDIDGDGTIDPTKSGLVMFTVNGDDDTHGYVNGVLVSTDPGGHGGRDAANTGPGLTLKEGQLVDFVLLQAEQGGGSATGMKWALGDGGVSDWIPNTNITPVPSRPQASGLSRTGTLSSHQASFSIDDSTTSEQRFELWRKPAGAPDSAFTKINEAGINSRTINDANGIPGQSFDYALVGFNFASGYTDLTSASRVNNVTFPADPAPTAGLQAFYFNNSFWGQGENRPLPRLGNFYVGSGGGPVGGADVHEFAPISDATHTLDTAADPTVGGAIGTHAISMNYGGDEHDPSILPGGSPNPLIRDNDHSTLWTGKLVITEPGSYQVMAFSDDDGLVIVDNTITSADLAGHGIRDPRVTPNANDRFTNAITLTAGEHDLNVFQAEGGGGSGIRLMWIRPGQTNPEFIPEANLSTKTTAPTAAGTPAVTDTRGTSAVITAADNSTNELKNVVVLATDALFTQNVRRTPVGIQVATGSPGGNPTSLRLNGLTPNTPYFVKVISYNMEGSAESTVTTFNSGGPVAPAAPTTLAGRGIAPNQIRLTWVDNAIDETGYLIRRRRVGEATFTDVDTTLANATNYIDTLPDSFTLGTQVEYQVVAQNAAGNSAPSNTLTTIVGGAGGTGLRHRIWNNTTDTLVSNDLPSNNGTTALQTGGRVGEPAWVGDPAAPGAPAIDDVEGIVPNSFSGGAPDVNDRDIDTFAIEWVGQIQAEETKAYNFSVIGDDGVRLFINDQLVINNGWRDQGDTEYFSEGIPLTAGQKVTVRYQMYEQGGGATARLRWNGPGGTREDVPVSFMFPTLGAEDAVAQVPYRAPSNTSVFGLPGNTTTATPAHIDISWQDNAFGEGGYEIQRATNSTFTTGLVTIPAPDGTAGPAAPTGSNLYTDNGGTDAGGNPTPLVEGTTYYYRIRPVGSPTWTVAGSAKPIDRSVGQTDLAVPKFNHQNATADAWANITGPGTVTLTEAANDRNGTVWLNRAFDVDTNFTATFDIRMSAGSGADGMVFVIHNFVPSTPAGVDPTQVRALGGGGGGKGYGGITDSVAVTFDFYNNIDEVGLYTNGANSGDGPSTIPAGGNDPANWPLEPNNSINVREAINGSIDLNNSVIYRVNFIYDATGNKNGTPDDATDDTGQVTLEMRRADAAAGSPALFTTKFNVDIATAVGGPLAAMGFTAATGGANSKQEVLNFNYDGVGTGAPVTSVYVRGSSWLGDDGNAATTTFKEYLQEKGLGNSTYGYRLFDSAGTNNANDIIPWINVDEVVVQFGTTPTGAGIPATGMVLKGVKGDYTVQSVQQLDAKTYVLHLDHVLGGAGTAATNGDKVRLKVAGGGAAGAEFSMVMNVVQGDVNKSTSVLANDYSEVKARFFKNTKSPITGTNDYTPFHDVDGNGSILANDYSAVKARFFQALPSGTPASAAAAMFSSSRITEEVLA